MKIKYEKAIKKALQSFDKDVKAVLANLKDDEKDEVSMGRLLEEAVQLYEKFKEINVGRNFIKSNGFVLNQQVVREDDEEIYQLFDESAPFFILKDSTGGIYAVEPKYLRVKEI